MRWTIRWPLYQVRIAGPSMVPTLRHDDEVLVRRTTRVRPGDVVVGYFGDLPDELVVKRAYRQTADGRWELRSDNDLVPGDSRQHGPADVVGKVVWRYRPLRRSA